MGLQPPNLSKSYAPDREGPFPYNIRYSGTSRILFPPVFGNYC